MKELRSVCRDFKYPLNTSVYPILSISLLQMDENICPSTFFIPEVRGNVTELLFELLKQTLGHDQWSLLWTNQLSQVLSEITSSNVQSLHCMIQSMSFVHWNNICHLCSTVHNNSC